MNAVRAEIRSSSFMALSGLAASASLGHANQTGCRGVYLEAALSAAGALRAVYGNDSVTHFCTAEVGATIDLAVNDDAGTYAWYPV